MQKQKTLLHLFMPNNKTYVLSKQHIMIVYVVWVLSCIVFFVIGLSIKRPFDVSTISHQEVISPDTGAPILTNQTEGERIASNAANGARHSVQVVVVNNANDANRVVSELRRKGFTSAYISLPSSNSSPQQYSVKVGLYDLPTANQVAEELQRDFGFKGAKVLSN